MVREARGTAAGGGARDCARLIGERRSHGVVSTRYATAPLSAYRNRSGAVLLAAAVTALIWVKVDAYSYGQVWHSELSIRLGHAAVALDLRGWVNSGLMTFFFLLLPDGRIGGPSRVRHW
jgi:Na+/H+ antiporter 1